MIRCVEISLRIPDNEALTALATLRRLGIAVTDLERSDLYRCDVDGAHADDLPDAMRAAETIFNPNKHALRVREGAAPLAGEVWVDEVDAAGAESGGPVRLSGRTLPGVRTLERFTAWRLFTAPGEPAKPDLVIAATETLLCNNAFQKATR